MSITPIGLGSSPQPQTPSLQPTSTQDLPPTQTLSCLTSSPLPPSKPTRKEIYERIDDFICQIKTPKGTATGFCIGKNLILVPFHVVELVILEKINATQAKYEVKPIRCIYQGISYEADWYTLNPNTALALDCAIFTINDVDFPQMPDIPLFTDEIKPGEKVYFGGFPLTQEEPTFHGGVVSSVSLKNGLSHFTIDGTVVPGNSGSPVFVVQNNMLTLAGIISYQVADFDPESQKTIEILKELKMAKDGSGMNYSIQIRTSKGPETVKVNERDTICMALELIQRNLSTGIGKALHSQHLIDLCDGKPICPAASSTHDRPVMRDERLPGMLGRDVAYRNWYHRHVKGQNLCVQILSRQISASDHISPEEEKTLWDYYQSNPPHVGFAGLTTEDEFKKLKDKIESAKPKAIKKHKKTWEARLLEFKSTLPDLEPQIQSLLQLIGVTQNTASSTSEGTAIKV